MLCVCFKGDFRDKNLNLYEQPAHVTYLLGQKFN
jgi:hypothetical protein